MQSLNRLINLCDADESIPRPLAIIQDAAKCMEGNLQFPVSSHGKFIDEYSVWFKSSYPEKQARVPLGQQSIRSGPRSPHEDLKAMGPEGAESSSWLSPIAVQLASEGHGAQPWRDDLRAPRARGRCLPFGKACGSFLLHITIMRCL